MAENQIEADTMTDNINQPAHYKSASGLETIDVIEAFGLGFNRGNAIKYILRAGKKTADPKEDLAKAIFYLQRELKTLRAPLFYSRQVERNIDKPEGLK